jgi:hypothetical protein
MRADARTWRSRDCRGGQVRLSLAYPSCCYPRLPATALSAAEAGESYEQTHLVRGGRLAASRIRSPGRRLARSGHRIQRRAGSRIQTLRAGSPGWVANIGQSLIGFLLTGSYAHSSEKSF